MIIKKVILSYDIPDELPLSYGHKLRGFFAHKFQEVLFHQHKKDGSLRYKYPLIQYKIIDSKPVIVGLEDGAKLITEHFLDIEQLRIDNKEYTNPSGQLKVEEEELKLVDDYEMPVFKYHFVSPWLGLNQLNYKKYINQIKNSTKEGEIKFLQKILIGNILTFAKGVDWWIDGKVVAVPKLNEIPVRFKGEDMLGFKGEVYSNTFLPEYIGIGKATSRGFGTITREKIL